MPMIRFSPGTVIRADEVNQNFDNAVALDTARTIRAVHTFNPDTVGPPFALGTNAQGQVVAGFNADRVDGKHAADIEAAAGTTGKIAFWM